MLEAMLRPHRTLFLAKTATPPAGQGNYPTAATVEYWIIFQSVSLDVDELAFAPRQTAAPVKAYLRTARRLPEGTVVEVWLDRGVWVIVEGPSSVGKAKWIEFELVEVDMGSSNYTLADVIDFHDGCNPDPKPNPDARLVYVTGLETWESHAGTLTERYGNTSGKITCVNHGFTTPGDLADVVWNDGKREAMRVLSVSGNDVDVDHGFGDNLPAETTAIGVLVRSPTAEIVFVKEGVLTERTSNTAGKITSETHGLEPGYYVSVYWNYGANGRINMNVGTVVGDEFAVSGGTGDVLPDLDTALGFARYVAGPTPPTYHGWSVNDYADVFWQVASVDYWRRRMLVRVVDCNRVELQGGVPLIPGVPLPALYSAATAAKSFVIWNTRFMYSGFIGLARGPWGKASFSPAKPAWEGPGMPWLPVPEQQEDRYYIDSMECQTPNS
jgi:hypothetical protein